MTDKTEAPGLSTEDIRDIVQRVYDAWDDEMYTFAQHLLNLDLDLIIRAQLHARREARDKPPAGTSGFLIMTGDGYGDNCTYITVALLHHKGHTLTIRQDLEGVNAVAEGMIMRGPKYWFVVGPRNGAEPEWLITVSDAPPQETAITEAELAADASLAEYAGDNR